MWKHLLENHNFFHEKVEQKGGGCHHLMNFFKKIFVFLQIMTSLIQDFVHQKTQHSQFLQENTPLHNFKTTKHVNLRCIACGTTGKYEVRPPTRPMNINKHDEKTFPPKVVKAEAPILFLHL